MLTNLRRELRGRRRALAPFRRRLANLAIVRHVLTLSAFRRARHVALYWPVDGEVDLLGLVTRARKHGKSLYLPVVGRDGSMVFAPWPATAGLRPNRYGIPEPAGMGRRSVPAARLDLVIVPMVGFDSSGNRLGMGAGYYDRALAGCRRRTVLVGTAFSCQWVEALPARHWDVPLDAVVTERGLVRHNASPPGGGLARGTGE